MNPLLMRIIRWLLDAVLAWWFFRPIKPEARPSAGRTALALLCLAAISPIYIFNTAASYWLRFILRTAAYALYLFFMKGFSFKRCIYYAVILWLSFNICFNIFLTDVLYPWFFSPDSGRWLGTVLLHILYAVLMMLLRELIPFRYIPEPGLSRIMIAALLAAAQLLIKEVSDLIAMGRIQAPASISLYLIITQVFLGISLIIFERVQSRSERLQKEELADISSRYRYQSAVQKQEASEDIRRLHHDMKNHLLAMQQISGDNERLADYISGLMDQLGNYEMHVHTGNALLDGLIAEKMKSAKKDAIDISAKVDLADCGREIEDIDICVIFGNLIDNAIEACRKVNDTSRRSILIKSSQTESNLVINISNFYEGTLDFSDGIPQTSKADRKNHGIGLRSVRHSVEKYGGTISFRSTEENRLIITILIPL